MNADTENVAPQGVQMRSRGARKPLGLRDSNSNFKPLGNSKPLSVKSGGLQPTQQKRRALGDITNRSNTTLQPNKNNTPKNPTINIAPHKKVHNSFGLAPVERRFEIPRDMYGNIEEPEIIPQAPPPKSFEPDLDLSDLDVDMGNLDLQESHSDDDVTEKKMPSFLASLVEEDEADLFAHTKPLIYDDEDNDQFLFGSHSRFSTFNQGGFISTDDFDALEIV